MPLDTNIAMGIKPVEQPNMLGQMAQVMAIRQAQQGYESQNALSDAYQQAYNTGEGKLDPNTIYKNLANSGQGHLIPKAQEHFGKIAQEQAALDKNRLESAAKKIEILGASYGGLVKNPTLEYAQNMFENLVATGAISKDEAAGYYSKLVANPDPKSIAALALQAENAAITAQAKMQDATSRRNADVTSGPGYLQAGIAREKLTQEQKDRAELDTLYGRPSAPPSVSPMGGGSGNRPPSAAPTTFGGGNAPSSVPNALPATVGATPVAPASPNMLRPDAQAPATTPMSTAAPVGDLYAQIEAIDAQISKLPINNPKAIPIIQALNAQRTQLLASAQREYGGDLVDMAMPHPTDPTKTITVKGRRDKYGVLQPAEMGGLPLSADLPIGGTGYVTNISPTVARPPPRAGYQYNAKGEEVKIPQTGVPEGVRLKPDERWNEAKQVVEQVPGSAAFIEQQQKHAKDLGAFKTLETTTKWGKDRIDTILDPKNKSGFEGNFGGFNAILSQHLTGNTAKVKSELDSLKSELREKGLQIFRAGGSIGAMTEREWPIMESMIASLNPKLEENDARDILKSIKAKFESLERLASEKYNDQWQGTQYHKPGSASGVSSSLTGEDKAAMDWANANPKDPRAAQIRQRLGG